MTDRRKDSSRQGKPPARDAPDQPGGRTEDAQRAGPPAQDRWSSEQLYRELIEQVRDYAIFCMDLDGRATTWNGGVERVLGYAEDEFLGRDVSQSLFTAEDIREGVPQWEMRESKRAGSASDNRWMVKKDGSLFYCLGVTTALRDERGDLFGFGKLMQDRTVQHLQGEELKQRTDELAAANAEKDRFLAVLSHELRNPLAPIRNAVDVLRIAPSGSEDATRAVEAIDRQSRHLGHLVDELLDVTRIEQGKIVLQRESVRLDGLVRATAADHEEAFGGNGVAFSVETGDKALRVHADPVRLSQVVGNLLDNARKFTPAGGRVTLSLTRGDGEAVLSVHDTGAGMDAETQRALFQPFMQGEATAARSAGGLGLGLALVKGLVELHGGRVEGHSEGAGRGSEFVVRLPLASGPIPKGGSDDPARLAVPRRRILIIEDNADTADMLSTALTLRGHDVEVALGGQKGLEKAFSFGPDVVLCDLGLPGLDGYSIARRLREDRRSASMRLVALSGHALPSEVARAIQSGFDSHIAKPPDLNAVDREISIVGGGPTGPGDVSRAGRESGRTDADGDPMS